MELSKTGWPAAILKLAWVGTDVTRGAHVIGIISVVLHRVKPGDNIVINRAESRNGGKIFLMRVQACNLSSSWNCFSLRCIFLSLSKCICLFCLGFLATHWNSYRARPSFASYAMHQHYAGSCMSLTDYVSLTKSGLSTLNQLIVLALDIFCSENKSCLDLSRVIFL
jgi:hypothetical protein